MLGLLAFMLLWLVWMLGNYAPREFRGVGIAAIGLFVAASIWRILKLKAGRDKFKGDPVAGAPSQ